VHKLKDPAVKQDLAVYELVSLISDRDHHDDHHGGHPPYDACGARGIQPSSWISLPKQISAKLSVL
jgi:hypothetical protein